MVGFEPTCPVKDKTISNRSRYDHFDTSPYSVVKKAKLPNYRVARLLRERDLRKCTEISQKPSDHAVRLGKPVV